MICLDTEVKELLYAIHCCDSFLFVADPITAWAEPFHESELIFPLESWHNHGSCIVECPNGDLLVCWFHGSGERRSDDVLIRGARWVKTTGKWTEPFLMADAPGLPDTNCCMIIDPQERLWLLWPTIQANTWESALMKYKISTDYMTAEGPPAWDVMKVLHVKPGDDFEAKVRAKTAAYGESIGIELTDRPQDVTVSDEESSNPSKRGFFGRLWQRCFGKNANPEPEEAPLSRAEQWAENNYKQAADKLTRRIGWFTRAHPYIVDDGKMLVGLYSDGFSFSLVAITEDWGDTWTFSDPIVGGGNIQPSFARKKDGTLVTYMRDNGPPPQRVLVSESKDEGVTWSTVYDHAQLKNPGSGLELANLDDGDWICVYNDTVRGRHSLAVSVSDDEGETWKWTRHLELGKPGDGSFHYPSIIQAGDGTLHASYSYFVPNDGNGGGEGKSIRYAHFNKEWILAGDPE